MSLLFRDYRFDERNCIRNSKSDNVYPWIISESPEINQIILTFTRSINLGILYFIHSIVNAEICFYCLLKSYQFQLNTSTNCFESIIRTAHDTVMWQYVSYSIIFHVSLQYVYSCSRSCFIKCKIGKKLYPYLGKFVVFVTFVCMSWSCAIYIWVCYLLKDSYTESNILGITIVSACILLATLGIFPFPFCREVTSQVFESWDCVFYRFRCCNCCCKRARRVSEMRTYADRFGLQEALLTDNAQDNDDIDDYENTLL